MKRAKPYVKQIDAIPKITVWLVDGKYIRDHIDEEFPNYGQHDHYKFIPKNEFWIDHKSPPQEIGFYVDHLLRERRLVERGVKYEKALEKADTAEKKERKKADFPNRDLREMTRAEKVAKVHKKLLRTYSKYLKVWIVHGGMVRDLFLVDFVEGGHDKVYDFVPEKEVWIDDAIKPQERRYILYHELHERHLMAGGKDYDTAHQDSSRVEKNARHHPQSLNKKLKEVIEQNRE